VTKEASRIEGGFFFSLLTASGIIQKVAFFSITFGQNVVELSPGAG
jgi:hypothetical protein